MKNFKEFIIFFSLFCLFFITNHYYPKLYNLIQTVISIPISIFIIYIIYKFISWVILYIRIKIKNNNSER